VLFFPVLNNETVSRKIPVYRERVTPTILARISEESWEAVLPTVVWFRQDLGYEVEDVLLVALCTGRHGTLFSNRRYP
jgi:hypothetical protein